MVGHGGSSAGSYLADPTSPIPSHCASIVTTSTVRVNFPALAPEINLLVIVYVGMHGLTVTVLVTIIDAQWEGMGDVGSARYKLALLFPCPTIRV